MASTSSTIINIRSPERPHSSGRTLYANPRLFRGRILLTLLYQVDYLPSANAFFDEFLGTFILVFVIFAVTDTSRAPTFTGLLPLALFFAFVGITSAFGMQTSFALNPARG